MDSIVLIRKAQLSDLETLLGFEQEIIEVEGPLDPSLNKGGLYYYDIPEMISEKEFIRNDIVLGKEGQDGILLYGVNAGGKSTLMKSIGLNIIMAQAGLWVAAGTFCFKPYKNIFTRIMSNDNILNHRVHLLLSVWILILS